MIHWPTRSVSRRRHRASTPGSATAADNESECRKPSSTSANRPSYGWSQAQARSPARRSTAASRSRSAGSRSWSSTSLTSSNAAYSSARESRNGAAALQVNQHGQRKDRVHDRRRRREEVVVVLEVMNLPRLQGPARARPGRAGRAPVGEPDRGSRRLVVPHPCAVPGQLGQIPGDGRVVPGTGSAPAPLRWSATWSTRNAASSAAGFADPNACRPLDSCVSRPVGRRPVRQRRDARPVDGLEVLGDRVNDRAHRGGGRKRGACRMCKHAASQRGSTREPRDCTTREFTKPGRPNRR